MECQFLFLFHKWLEELIISRSLSIVISSTVLLRVSNVIQAQSWYFLTYFLDPFPSVVQQVLPLSLLLTVQDDELIW